MSETRDRHTDIRPSDDHDKMCAGPTCNPKEGPTYAACRCWCHVAPTHVMLDTSYHRRRSERRMADPEYREAYRPSDETARPSNDLTGAVVEAARRVVHSEQNDTYDGLHSQIHALRAALARLEPK